MTTRNCFDVWLANLNPPKGTEPGKVRPVVIVQNNVLNKNHPSTIICPISSKIIDGAEPLRVRIGKGQTEKPSDILVDQIRSIDNRRLVKCIGKLTETQSKQLAAGIRAVLAL